MAGAAIVWFRRDLRVHDHPALTAAVAEGGPVLPVYVLDERLLAGRFASAPRAAFLRDCLRELDAALAERGAPLVVRAGRPEAELPRLAADAGAASVHWTSDVSPFARSRDAAVTAGLRAAGVAARPHAGNFCADVSLPRTRAGAAVTVFAAFRRQWEQLERRPVLAAPRRIDAPRGVEPGAVPDGPALADVLAQPCCGPGEAAARAAASAWLDGPLDAYAERHDELAGGTSVLSPYLRWGCISPRELEARARERGGEGAEAFVRQLAWRDFFAHVLLRFPDDLRREHQERFRDLDWSEDPVLLEAWQQGRTGYPLVDAGMRQLATTGWMHNRARMVTGSFLTKDLHLDWRAGEAWFARLLLDGEPAQNNGNWQWIASTGVDPAPYFRRMFNPVLQQRRFDPGGAYVRRWVPELARVPDARLAEPWTMTPAEQAAAGCVIGRDYPAPVVDHAQERRVAIERYRAAGGD